MTLINMLVGLPDDDAVPAGAGRDRVLERASLCAPGRTVWGTAAASFASTRPLLSAMVIMMIGNFAQILGCGGCCSSS